MTDPLEQARGFFDLGLYEESWLALEELPPEVQNSRDVIRYRLLILGRTERWRDLTWIIKSTVQLHPDLVEAYILGAEALRHEESLEAGYRFLMSGHGMVDTSPASLYKRACFETQLGNLEDAGLLLREAWEAEPWLKKKAVDDPDLAPWWDAM